MKSLRKDADEGIEDKDEEEKKTDSDEEDGLQPDADDVLLVQFFTDAE